MLSQAVGLAALGGKKGGIVLYLSKVGRPGADIGMSRRTRRSRRSSVRKSSNHHLCERPPAAASASVALVCVQAWRISGVWWLCTSIKGDQSSFFHRRKGHIYARRDTQTIILSRSPYTV